MAREAPIDSDSENGSVVVVRALAPQYGTLHRQLHRLENKIDDMEKGIEVIKANQETLQNQLRQMQASLDEIAMRQH